MKENTTARKITIILLLTAAIAASVFYGKTLAGKSEHHNRRISYLEEKKDNAKDLIAAANSAAFLISLLPEDTATPNANQIADIGKDFLIILSALTAEQYLLGITGQVAFVYLIPIGLVLAIISMLIRRLGWMRRLTYTLLLFSIALYSVIPLSIFIAGTIDDTYQKTVNATIEATQELEKEYQLSGFPYDETEGSTEVETEWPAETEKEKTLFGSLKDKVFGAGEAVSETVGTAVQSTQDFFSGAADTITSIPGLGADTRELARQYMEAFVIMLVTTCVIPLLTMLTMALLLHLVCGIDFNMPQEQYRSFAVKNEPLKTEDHDESGSDLNRP